MATEKTTYFAWMLYDKMGKNAEIKSVHRTIRGPESLQMERYDVATGEWIFNPGLGAVSGVGGDSAYEEISREEAITFVKSVGKEPVSAAQF